MFHDRSQSFAVALLAASLLLTGCSEGVDSESVAKQFIQAYYVQDNMAEAVKLTGGEAKTTLEKLLQAIASADVKEPADEKPAVETTLVATQSSSADEVTYVYHITSAEQGIETITATLKVNKQGKDWYITAFNEKQ